MQAFQIMEQHVRGYGLVLRHLNRRSRSGRWMIFAQRRQQFLKPCASMQSPALLISNADYRMATIKYYLFKDWGPLLKPVKMNIVNGMQELASHQLRPLKNLLLAWTTILSNNLDPGYGQHLH